jgi:hypothetical protein
LIGQIGVPRQAAATAEWSRLSLRRRNKLRACLDGL